MLLTKGEKCMASKGCHQDNWRGEGCEYSRVDMVLVDWWNDNACKLN